MLLNDRDQIIAMTAEWTGERYPNGRPRVSDEKIEILKNLTQEEIWQPLYSCGYRFQFQCNLVRRTEKGRLRRRGWGLRWEKAQKGGKGTNLRGFFED